MIDSRYIIITLEKTEHQKIKGDCNIGHEQDINVDALNIKNFQTDYPESAILKYKEWHEIYDPLHDEQRTPEAG